MNLSTIFLILELDIAGVQILFRKRERKMLRTYGKGKVVPVLD
jgi:hypothetical protein